MAKSEITAAIDEITLTDFFAKVRQHIQTHRIITGQKFTKEELCAQPSLYIQCQVKEAGNCPDKGFALNCHTCPHAKKAMEIAAEVAPKSGFDPRPSESYPDIGAIGMTLFSHQLPDYINLTIHGDENGKFYASSHPVRRSIPD